MRGVSAAAMCVLMLALWHWAAQAQVVLIPTQASGYKFKVGAFDDGVAAPSFDDSGYADGTAPFTSLGNTYCMNYDIWGWPNGTRWPLRESIAIRRRFTSPGEGAGMRLQYGVDNTADIYLNGTLLASVVNSGCASPDQRWLDIPPGVLRRGENTLVVLATDDGSANYFDMSLTADLATVAPTSTWGRLKLTYR